MGAALREDRRAKGPRAWVVMFPFSFSTANRTVISLSLLAVVILLASVEAVPDDTVLQ